MTYHFGAFRYDADQRLLFRGADRVTLVPKAVETLHALIERHGKVVEKAELMRLVWPDAVVEEIGLARNISFLRKALLDDEAAEHPIIETVPRRGYRFAAPITFDTPAVQNPKSRRWMLAIPLAAVAAALIYYQFYVPSRFLPPAGGALAVVPFPCACPDIDSEAFSAGLTDLLVADLSQLPALHVVAPSTVRRHQRAGMSMGLMGRLLGLDTLVEGNVQRFDGAIRTTARLVDVHTGKVIWSETFHQPAGDLASAQSNTSRLVAAAIGVRLASKPTR